MEQIEIKDNCGKSLVVNCSPKTRENLENNEEFRRQVFDQSSNSEDKHKAFWLERDCQLLITLYKEFQPKDLSGSPSSLKMTGENANDANTQGATQSQSSNLWTQVESQPIENVVWGRLYSKNVKVKTLDLCHEKFSAGRGDGNDFIFTSKEISNEKILCRVSKVHFQITRENCDRYNPVYIKDCSRNGTFVNGEVIGLNKSRILQNNDVIAINLPQFRAFEYRDSYLHEGQELPLEITSNYHINKKLGSGAFGMVRLVYDCRTCIKYALKHVKKNIMESGNINSLADHEKVMNEGKIMKKLSHPCVIKMHEIVNTRESLYMVLEFMGGGDLLQRIISKKRLTDQISKLYFYQLCHAVQYLHGKGITHRDLKPDNVLLHTADEETLLKVSDFGLSKQPNTVMRTLCGTPQYVAPEVLVTQGRGSYTRNVDIWSLGVVLFTCLSGTLPFHEDYGTPVCDQIKKGKFKFDHPAWKVVPQRAKSLITVMLTVDPNARPSIDCVLGHSWLRDKLVIQKAKSLMKIETRSLSDEENFLQPPEKRIKL